jgi:putative membrane protein
MPMVLISAAWASLVSLMASMLSKSTGQCYKSALQAHGSSATFSLLAAPLALLLTLRANASVSRLFEGRLLFGSLVTHSRSLASVLKIHVFPHYPQAATLAARHLVLVGWILKASLRSGESFESEQQVISAVLGTGKDAMWLSSQNKRTVAVTSRLRQICSVALAEIASTNSTTHSYSYGIQFIVEERIADLEQAVGGCDRLFSSPIPPTYSRHLSRVISMWIFLMPMSFVGAGLSPLGVVVAAAVSTYVFVGIDEVGMEIEQVFKLLPLQQLAAAVQKDVMSEFVPNGSEMPDVSL